VLKTSIPQLVPGIPLARVRPRWAQPIPQPQLERRIRNLAQLEAVQHVEWVIGAPVGEETETATPGELG